MHVWQQPPAFFRGVARLLYQLERESGRWSENCLMEEGAVAMRRSRR